jgi:hypothetical protein
MTALPYPPGGVPWYRKPGFKLVAVKEEECLRVPVELLSKEPKD